MDNKAAYMLLHLALNLLPGKKKSEIHSREKEKRNKNQHFFSAKGENTLLTCLSFSSDPSINQSQQFHNAPP